MLGDQNTQRLVPGVALGHKKVELECGHLRLQILKQDGSQLCPMQLPRESSFPHCPSGLPRKAISLLKRPEGQKSEDRDYP